MIDNLSSISKGLVKQMSSEKFKGYDPYDLQNSLYLKSSNNYLLSVFLTQFFKFSPLNLRNLLKVPKGINPKALGLILKAYVKLYKLGILENEKERSYLVKLLIKLSSKGYSGLCWGYNFPWQSKNRYLPKFSPTIVNTSFVADAFLDLFELTNEKKYLQMAESSCDFIINDLNVTEDDNGLCFSYTTIDSYVIHNANLLGASLLSRVSSHNHNSKYLDYSRRAFDFSIGYQCQNGMWNYGYDKDSGKEYSITDWHQGFILDSIFSYIKYAKPKDKKYMRSVIKGLNFYREKQFKRDGRSYYRWPTFFPIDIHNQAQGIITFCNLSFDPKNFDFSKVIMDWTLKNMYDVSGYFYYQDWYLFKNKISYMRWNQAWMLLAMSTLLESMKTYEAINKK